eukprot:690953-Pelagomonas_calceolata.AAC.9
MQAPSYPEVGKCTAYEAQCIASWLTLPLASLKKGCEMCAQLLQEHTSKRDRCDQRGLLDKKHAALCATLKLNQGSSEIQGIEDSAWLSRRCLPGPLETEVVLGSSPCGGEELVKVFAPKMTPLLNSRLRSKYVRFMVVFLKSWTLFLAGTVQQAEQPNYLAESRIPLQPMAL